MRAELPFAGGSARGKKLFSRSLVLGGALLFVANFGSRLRMKKIALGLSGDAADQEANTRAEGSYSQGACGGSTGASRCGSAERSPPHFLTPLLPHTSPSISSLVCARSDTEEDQWERPVRL